MVTEKPEAKKNFFLIHLKKNHQAERQLTDAQHIDIST